MPDMRPSFLIRIKYLLPGERQETGAEERDEAVLVAPNKAPHLWRSYLHKRMCSCQVGCYLHSSQLHEGPSDIEIHTAFYSHTAFNLSTT